MVLINSDDYTFSFDDCGYWLDASGHAQGEAQLRVGKGDLTSAFFLVADVSFSVSGPLSGLDFDVCAMLD
jgi:hypothetical protein